MSALTKESAADNATFDYLFFAQQITQQFAAAGDVRVEDFRYWNVDDSDASAQNGQLYAYNLVHFCLQKASYYGVTWKSATLNDQAQAMTALCTVMTTQTSLVSDISAQLTAMFNFKTPFSA